MNFKFSFRSRTPRQPNRVAESGNFPVISLSLVVALSFLPSLFGTSAIFAWAAGDEEKAVAEKETSEETRKEGEGAPSLDAPKKGDGPFAPSAISGLSKKKDSPAVSYKNAKGEEIPVIDDQGKVVYHRPEDKNPSEMTERDFYLTLTPYEKATLQNNPESGPDLLEAAIRIAQSGRPEFAVFLAKKGLAAAGGTSADYAALLDRVGPDRLLAFENNPITAEVAKEASAKIRTEFAKYWSDPKVIQEAFDRSFKGSEEDKIVALADFQKGGEVAFTLLLQELISDEKPRETRAKSILNHFGPFAREGLLATLKTNDEKLLARMADVLTETVGLTDVGPLASRYYDESLSAETREALKKALIAQRGSVPSPAEAAAELRDLGLRRMAGKIPVSSLVDGVATVWVWNEKAGKAERQTLSEAQIWRLLASDELMMAHRLSPENAGLRSEAMVALAERLLYDGGLDSPPDVGAFQQVFPDLSPRELESALAWAVDAGHPKGGIIPTILIGRTEDVSLVVGDGQPTVLVRAARSSDRRLRYAALTAIGAICPKTSYPGIGSVVSSLMEMTVSSGRGAVIVAMPKLDETMNIGHWLTNGDRRILPARNGGEVIRLAQTDPDVEFVVAVSYLRDPDIRTVAQTLADDYRTNGLPILVAIEDETRMDQASDYGRLEKNVLVGPLPFDKKSGEWAIRELFRKICPEPVPAESRLAQAKGATLILAKLLESGYSEFVEEDFEPLTARLLTNPKMMEEALALAVVVSSGSIQALLGDLVGDNRFEIPQREKFLAAFRDHVKRHGLRLRGPDIVRLYDRYNRSEKEPEESQKVLSDLLDTIEEAQGVKKDAETK